MEKLRKGVNQTTAHRIITSYMQ